MRTISLGMYPDSSERKLTLGNIDTEFFGIIIPGKSRIAYRNQTGGVKCLHPSIEGSFIPLPVHWLTTPKMQQKDPLGDYGTAEYDTALVERFLACSDYLNEHFGALTADEFQIFAYVCGATSAPGISPVLLAEAWVPVRVRRFGYHLPKDLVNTVGILVWENSD